MNTKGMLPYENKVLHYIAETGNHVLYRVTPVFEGDNLLASGVLMEAYSLEDAGSGLMYCVYAYNVQPGIVLDYQTGDSYQDGDVPPAPTEPSFLYLVNIYSKKFHKTDCKQGRRTRVVNKRLMYGTREMLILLGYKPAQCCDP
jgi:DNA-entry nuclease